MSEVDIDLDSLNVEVSVKLRNGDTEKFNVKDEIQFSRNSLDQAYMDQPGKYAWWGMVAEVAKRNVEESKLELEEAEAKADERIREEFEIDGKKITEAAVNRQIKASKEYKKAYRALLKAKQNSGILTNVLRAFDHRMQSLIGFGASVRKEGDNVELEMLKEKAKKVVNKKN